MYLVLSQNPDKLAAALALVPGLRGFQCDIRSSDSIDAVFKQLEAEQITIVGLVNSAGVSIRSPLRFQPESDIRCMLDTNLLGSLLTCQAVIKHMIAREIKGNIVNISSVGAERSGHLHIVYSATKAGINGFTRALATEVGPMGIKVNVVAPGYVETDMTQGHPKADIEEMVNHIPLGRPVSIEEVAKTVLFLLETQDITGTVVTVDGGLLSRLV